MEKEKRNFKTTFLSYKEISNIGEGGASNVYKVSSNYKDKQFALKLLKEEISKDSDKYLRFLNEFAFCINNPHQNLVQIIDSGNFNKSHFYIMPLADKTLRACIKENNLTIKSKIKIMKDILDGLVFLHSKGVIHRDLKPENILIYGDTAKIADLGISHFIKDDKIEHIKTDKSDRFANFQYAAPEQKIKNNATNLTTSCDIYSFALIIYELFTGEYSSGNRNKKIQDIHSECGYLDNIIDKALCEDPDNRIKNAKEFSEELKFAEYDINIIPCDYCSQSTHFKIDRFDKAFPDTNKQYIFTDKDLILKRVSQLLRPPYEFVRQNQYGGQSTTQPVWWTRGDRNNPILDFYLDNEKKLAYIGGLECNIKKLIAFDSIMYYRPFVYIELEGMQQDSEMQCYEDMLSFVDGKRISYSESEKGYYIDENGNSIKIDPKKQKSFTRYYKTWNFLILSSWHPFMQSDIEYELRDLMNDILSKKKDPKDLLKLLEKTKKPDFDSWYRNFSK